MGAVPVNTSSSHDGASVEPGTRIQHNQNGINNGSLPEEQCQGSSEEDGSTCNGIAEYGNNHPTWEVQACDDFQVQPQQPQGPIIVWERFLPLKTVKVLLVENDDSTRHVVSALLRNCGYEVTAVANGLQAWKILEDLTDQIDLVLTEVVMPLLSGIGLLSKIMGHKTLKNIPVIMMSSHDSMGIVFKCLSKGAVDFLVKPIRKNELKNLWQHVWRRCHSSSGSGSESVTHTKKSRDLRSNDDSETNNGSSDEQASRSNGLSMQNGSDDGSGTQSSWTKKTEVESPRPVSPWNGWADAPDSTCARVIYAGTEKLKLDEGDPGNGGQGDDGKQSPRCQDSQHDCQCETELNVSSVIELKPLDKGQTELNRDLGGKTGESKTAQMCGTANCISVQTESRVFDCGDDLSRISNIKSIAHCNPGELPSLELTLKRLEEQGNSGHSSHDNHKVLRHSDLSAFTKFNTVSSVNQGQAGNAGNCSAFDNCSTAMRRESNFPSSSHGTPCQQSNVGSNNNEMALGGKTPKQPEQLSTFKSSGSSAFQPVQHGYVSSSRQELSARAKDACSNLIQAPSNSSHQHIHIRYHHHHHHHHYHHHLDSLQQQEQQPEHEDSSLKSVAIAAPQCGSSNAFGGHTEGNNGNCSVNASVSGSNHGSNGDNGSNDAPNGGETIQRKDDGVAGNNGDGCAVEKVNGAALDERRIALREAALSKFRQKRKERCFEKRVRYESRKKLAEQRPRIRGQFVRQIVSDSRATNDCQSNDSLSRDNSCDSVQ